MDRETRQTALATFLILGVFCMFLYFVPTIMLAVGKISPVLGVLVVALVLLAPFVFFWLRSRSRNKN